MLVLKEKVTQKATRVVYMSKVCSNPCLVFTISQSSAFSLGDPYLFVKNIARKPFVRTAIVRVPTISIKVKREKFCCLSNTLKTIPVHVIQNVTCYTLSKERVCLFCVLKYQRVLRRNKFVLFFARRK